MLEIVPAYPHPPSSANNTPTKAIAIFNNTHIDPDQSFTSVRSGSYQTDIVRTDIVRTEPSRTDFYQYLAFVGIFFLMIPGDIVKVHLEFFIFSTTNII